MKECVDKRISRKEHYFLTHPDCEKLVESYGSYPAAPDGKCLCAKTVGYADRCYAGEGFFDCRDCWSTTYEDMTGYLSPEEQEEYEQVLDEQFKDTGININDLV